MSALLTESDSNVIDSLVEMMLETRRIKPHQLIMVFKSIVAGIDHLPDKDRGVFVKTRVFYKERKKHKMKKIKVTTETLTKRGEIETEEIVVMGDSSEVKEEHTEDKSELVMIQPNRERSHKIIEEPEHVRTEVNRIKPERKGRNVGLSFSIKVSEHCNNLDADDCAILLEESNEITMFAQEHIIYKNSMDVRVKKAFEKIIEEKKNPIEVERISKIAIKYLSKSLIEDDKIVRDLRMNLGQKQQMLTQDESVLLSAEERRIIYFDDLELALSSSEVVCFEETRLTEDSKTTTNGYNIKNNKP